FGHLAVAIDFKSVWSLRDRHDAAVDRGRQAPVDQKLLLASVLALFQRRVVQKRQADRTLDLQHALGFKEDDGDVRVDLRLRAFAEKGEHRLLTAILALVCHHGRSTAAPVSLPSRRSDNASLAS